MGMPITIEIVDRRASDKDFKMIFKYFTAIDEIYSTYKNSSVISKINRGEITINEVSDEVKLIFSLAEKTKKESGGYFDISKDGVIDPSGIVKGWAIFKAAEILLGNGYENFYIDAGGDIQVAGKNNEGKFWTIGIKNPFNKEEIIKVLQLKNKGVATSGNYMRGDHIYNPKKSGEVIDEIVSLTVVGPNVYEADRFATAAFAMGKKGIEFIEKLDGFEGYQIDKAGIATFTSNFEEYVV
jgi:thiamine biosynthesis lipoprotein